MTAPRRVRKPTQPGVLPRWRYNEISVSPRSLDIIAGTLYREAGSVRPSPRMLSSCLEKVVHSRVDAARAFLPSSVMW